MATIEEIRLLIPGLATKADVAIMMADFANMKADMLTKVDLANMADLANMVTKADIAELKLELAINIREPEECKLESTREESGTITGGEIDQKKVHSQLHKKSSPVSPRRVAGSPEYSLASFLSSVLSGPLSNALYALGEVYWKARGWTASSNSYGANALYAAFDCSARNCPSGTSWADLSNVYNVAHRQAECSNKGECDRSTGRCKCFENFEGPACERMKCPNDCSGHGRCLSMRQLAAHSSALPLSDLSYRYNLPSTYSNMTTRTWDSDKIYGCLCDSSWDVGLASNQTQEPEWFGADCSLRHCPSADNPRTAADETNCFNKTAKNSNSTGALGNKCHVDCADLGICDYTTGVCNCFTGYYGLACNSYEALYHQISITPTGDVSSSSSSMTTSSYSSDFLAADAITFSEV
eukprot:gene32030-41538_t